MTDHKLLIGIFNKIKAQALFRIERIRLKLKSFCYTVEHIYDASKMIYPDTIFLPQMRI